MNRLILGSVHRLFMGRVHRLSHGPCPPYVSRVASTVCLTCHVHRLSHGPCPPYVSWVASTVCLMGRVHRLSNGPRPSSVSSAVYAASCQKSSKSYQDAAFVDAVGRSLQAKHTVGLLSSAQLERLVANSEQSKSPLTGVMYVSDIWSDRTGIILKF